MANKKVRVLVDGAIDGVFYRCNDVVNLPDTLAKAHADAVDAGKEAVSYALSINEGVVIEHVVAVEVVGEPLVGGIGAGDTAVISV